jgi:monovalent cation:H+ antiporter-2, CPA2 family
MIIDRSETEAGARHLAELGTNYVVHPEFEGGLELIHHTLLSLGFPLQEVHQYAETLRHENYDAQVVSDEEYRSLHQLLRPLKGIEVLWVELSDSSTWIGRSLAEVDLRSQTGASVVALIRNKHLMANPKSATVYEVGDRIGMIGEKEQLELVEVLVHKKEGT